MKMLLEEVEAVPGTEEGSFGQYAYALYRPEGSSGGGSGSVPLLISLHGGGEAGGSLQQVRSLGLPGLIELGMELPCHILAPLNHHAGKFWNEFALESLVDRVCETHAVDPDRVYLTGMSRGGYGVWRLAMNNPGRFAAMLVICAASVPHIYAYRVRNIPVWIFHGAKDETVPPAYSEEMARRLTAEGAEVRYTLYPDADHDSWTPTYRNPEVFDWLFSKRRRPAS
jgi:predicted peptidase